MKRLTKEDINTLNKKVDSWDEGIFVQPNYIPTDIKDEVCFIRWNSSGKDGSCWDDENTVNEEYYYDEPEFKILKLALDKMGGNYEKITEIENSFIKIENDAGDYVGYYGDFSNYKAKWVRLETIYNYLGI